MATWGGRWQDTAETPGLAKTLKLEKEEMDVTRELVYQAMANAEKGHGDTKEVAKMKANPEAYADDVMTSIESGKYRGRLRYRRLKKTNPNGKVRKIKASYLFTFVLQHLFVLLTQPLYQARDNYNGLNCKKGCGITAKTRHKSVLRKLKRLMYDLRYLHYGVILDQRKCYEHITPKLFRREMRKLTSDRELIEFGVAVGFVDGYVPIGAPTSPLIHHIVMLEFDHWAKQVAPWSLRYADDCAFATYTKEDANALKWRVQNFWWYKLKIRAKASAIRVQPLDSKDGEEGVSLCGFVVHRYPNKGVCDHDKGFTRIRRNIRDRASKCKSDESWASYFGILRHADAYYLMIKIENKMKLRELTAKIRIERSLDAPNMPIKDLLGKTFTIHNYEIRNSEKDGRPNWVKCLIGIEEKDSEGKPTGKIRAYEFHTSANVIVQFMAKAEQEFGREALLPMEEMEIEDQCGYIFKGCTNQMIYIE